MSTTPASTSTPHPKTRGQKRAGKTAHPRKSGPLGDLAAHTPLASKSVKVPLTQETSRKVSI